MSRALRWLIRRWYVVVVVLVSVVFTVLAWSWASNQAESRDRDRKAATAARATLIAQNNRVIDCTTPGMPCFEESQRRTAKTLASAFQEIDCIARRVHALLPAYDPKKGTCASQTPPEVYPG